MAFWVIGVFMVISIIAVFFNFSDTFGFIGTMLFGIFTSVFIVMASFMLFWGIALLAPTSVSSTEQSTYQLRSLGVEGGITGRSYFLGGGYINSERVLNYIIKHEGGYNEAGSVDADESKIWEDTKTNPYMVRNMERRGNPWVAPFNYSTEYTYDFHVPEKSILETTQIGGK